MARGVAATGALLNADKALAKPAPC